jgi:topoisomerase-4 subunit A
MPAELEDDGVVEGDLEEIVRQKYAGFAAASNMRSIPDARDGLKPIHRRIVYGASKIPKAQAGGTTRAKSAMVVGEVMGKL